MLRVRSGGPCPKKFVIAAARRQIQVFEGQEIQFSHVAVAAVWSCFAAAAAARITLRSPIRRNPAIM